MESKTTKRLSELVQMAKGLVEQGLEADQIVVVETAKTTVYHFENHLLVKGKLDTGFADEERFIWMLKDKNDSEVKYIVCMWNHGAVEIPSMHFRELLMEASPKNADAIFVVLTEDGKGGFALGVRTVGWSMPPASMREKEE